MGTRFGCDRCVRDVARLVGDEENPLIVIHVPHCRGAVASVSQMEVCSRCAEDIQRYAKTSPAVAR